MGHWNTVRINTIPRRSKGTSPPSLTYACGKEATVSSLLGRCTEWTFPSGTKTAALSPYKSSKYSCQLFSVPMKKMLWFLGKVLFLMDSSCGEQVSWSLMFFFLPIYQTWMLFLMAHYRMLEMLSPVLAINILLDTCMTAKHRKINYIILLQK